MRPERLSSLIGPPSLSPRLNITRFDIFVLLHAVRPSMLHRIALCLLGLLVSATRVGAQNGLPDTGSCVPGTAEHIFESKHVKAKLLNDGVLFWRQGGQLFHLPKERAVSPVFSASLLLSGYVNGTLRAAGTTYNPREFWPGPIPKNGSLPVDCTEFDRFWRADWVSDAPEEDAVGSPTDPVREWPVDLGAPFENRDGTLGYDPDQGDLPWFMGDRMSWWVMNDAGGEHGRTKSRPLMVDVDVSVFAFDSDQPIGNALFFRYRITNRNDRPIQEMVVGAYVDGELGHFMDDRVGTDTTLSMLYFYNGDNDDDDGYGLAPPALGIALIEASVPGRVFNPDPVARARGMLSYTSIHHGGGGPQGDPQAAEDFRNQLTGRWKDGTPIYQGNIGYDPIYPPGPYWMPGDPVSGSFWSEVNIDGEGNEMWLADKKGYLSHGPFDLPAGMTATFTFVYALGQGVDHLDSITALRSSVETIQHAGPALVAPRGPRPPRFLDGNPPTRPRYPFWVRQPYPNPAHDMVTLEMSLKWDAPVSIAIHDVLSREYSWQRLEGQSGQTTHRMDVSSLPPGIYLIRVSQRGQYANWPLVVL